MAATALVLYYFLVYCNVCQCPFSAFRVGAPEQPRKVTDFFFSAKLFRKKKCWKSCEAGVGPGPLPGFLLKSECKVTNLRRNFQMFLQLFLRKNQSQARNALQTHRLQPQKKLPKPYPITTSQFKASIATISLPTKPPKNYTIKYLNNLFYVKNTPI